MSFSTIKPRKPSRCKICRGPYIKTGLAHKVCSPECGLALAKADRERAARKLATLDRAETAKRKEAIKPRSKWLAEAQAAFNSFIRARDLQMPCISCGRYHWGAHDAGHYRSVGSMPALRFHEDNCHRQCVPCNQHKAGNVIEYRIGLVARIGVDRVAFLEGPHEAAKFTIDDAKSIKAAYKQKLKELKSV